MATVRCFAVSTLLTGTTTGAIVALGCFTVSNINPGNSSSPGTPSPSPWAESSSPNLVPSTAGALAGIAGNGGGTAGFTVLAATIKATPENRSAGAVMSNPSKFVIVLNTSKLSALYKWK